MERPYILHMFTPGPQMSPFDVNMAADAGYQIITPYCGIGLEAVPHGLRRRLFELARSPDRCQAEHDGQHEHRP